MQIVIILKGCAYQILRQLQWTCNARTCQSTCCM